MHPSLDFSCHESLQRITSTLLRVWPEHAKYLTLRFRDSSPDRIARDELLASLILKLIEDDLELFCRDYRWMCEEFTQEELYFRRYGNYRLKTFAEANQNIYSNPAYMPRYVRGILMSQLLWSNHAGAVDLFRTRYLPLLPDRFEHLEIGPGHGLFAYFARSDSRSDLVTCWDVSSSSLAATREALKKLKLVEPVALVQKDVLDASSTQASFDSAIASEVLEHLERPDEALRNIHRALRPGGILFLNVPINSPAPDHIFLWRTPNEVTELVVSTGFSIKEHHLLPMTGYTIDQALKWRLSVSCILVAIKPSTRAD